MKKYLSIICVVLLFSCNKDNTTGGNMGNPDTPDPTNPNIIFIIADDMGKDATNGFVEGSIKPLTPHLDELRTSGLVFNSFWVNPTCSPTRASIITGKYGYRTGVKWASDELDSSEKILQKYINEQTNNGYATSIVGKWHLSAENTMVNPESFGLDYYAGLIRGAVSDYYKWQLYENGSISQNTEYISTVFTDLAINWVNAQSKPWFLWLAYNAPHTPFHVPPPTMHSQGSLEEYVEGVDPLPYYMAAIEAMDFQIGRLLDSIPENERDNTIVIFIGDNGTPNQVAQAPYTSNSVKGTLYQGGVNVPMYISGIGVDRVGEDDNLITSTDLFSTIAEIAGVTQGDINDSKSFKSLFQNQGVHRDYQYTEMDNGVDNQWAISNGLYKLIMNADGISWMFDVLNDPYEYTNLLSSNLTPEQIAAKSNLEQELAIIRN